MKDSAVKILLGDSIVPPETEVDEHDIEEQGKLSIENYYITSTLESIGSEQFESIYLLTKFEVNNLKSKTKFCNLLMETLINHYDFDFGLIELDNLDDTDDFLTLVEFIEYDHEEFIKEIKILGFPSIPTDKLDKFLTYWGKKTKGYTSYFLKFSSLFNIVNWIKKKI